MKINVNRLLIDCLPKIMRQQRIYALLHALCSQLFPLNEQIQRWRSEALRQASYTWQVASIERAVYEQLGTVISIVIKDGMPYDFGVVVESQGDRYDEDRLRAIIDRYKPAGRRYVIEGSDVYSTVKFVDYVCEMQDVVYTVAFKDYVCELEEIPRINNYITVFHSPAINGRVSINAMATYPVASYLTVSLESGVPIIIREGEKEGVSVEIDAYEDPGDILSVNPEQDDIYNYLF